MTMKKSKPLPSIEALEEALVADFEAGILRWKTRPRHHFPSDKEWSRWNTRHAGAIAGNSTKEGHLQLKLAGQLMYAHRVMWKLFHKVDPVGLVQHEDGNSTNNRPGNLVDDNHSTNMQNKKMHKNNTTGFRGVSRKKNGRFMAHIMINGVRYYLGYHPSAEDAAKAQMSKRQEVLGHAIPPCEALRKP